ncbi:phosphoribosylformylglycinamidine synthase subunit PurS [Candidatus Endolissoclinum faulkneri]|nr:phosphoribosylformylglycinamidine synthase subunit PurS [Candidatus Endolissoclinum faulkneri]
MRVTVYIKIKPEVLDPQGTAIARALSDLGFAGINKVRQGKIIEIDLDKTNAIKAVSDTESMCERLLANTIIEDYSISIGE